MQILGLVLQKHVYMKVYIRIILLNSQVSRREASRQDTKRLLSKKSDQPRKNYLYNHIRDFPPTKSPAMASDNEDQGQTLQPYASDHTKMN